MPPKKPASRTEAKEKSREALIEAALALFAEEGIDGPSLDAICERAGYTRGAFYVHFADREALLSAVMESVGRSYLASVLEGQGAGGPTPSFQSAVRRFVASVRSGDYPLMSLSKKGPLVRPHQLLAACARSDEVREHYLALVDAAVHAVKTIVEEDPKVRADVPTRDLAELTVAVVIGAQTLAELAPFPDPDLPRRLSTALEKLVAR